MKRAVLAAFILISCSVSFAQPEATSVSADDVVDCVLAQTVRLEAESLYRSSNYLNDAKSEFLPTLQATTGKQRTELSSSGSSTSSVTLSQRVFAPAVSTSIEVASLGLKATQYELLQKAFSNSRDAIDALFKLQVQSVTSELTLSQIKSFQTAVKIMSVSAKIGLSDSYDYLQSQSALLSNQAAGEQLTFEIEKAKRDFEVRFGFKPVDIGRLIAKPEESTFDARQLPELKSLRMQIAQSEGEGRKIARQVLPEILISGSYTMTSYESDSVAARPIASGAALLTLDLSGLWKNRQKLSSFDSIAQQKKNVLEQRERDWKNQFDMYDAELRLIERELPAFRQRMQIAQKSKELSLAKVQLGRTSFLELQQTEQNLYAANLQLTTAELRKKQLAALQHLGQRFSRELLRSQVRCAL